MDILKTCEEYICLLGLALEQDHYSLDKWDSIYDLEIEILTKFGLPPSFELSSFAQSAALSEANPKRAFGKFMELLKAQASDYLMSPVQTNKEILESGKRNKIPFDNVLPYMNMETHPYCVFVYEELYCKDKISVEETIEVLQILNDDNLVMHHLVSFNGDYSLQINFQDYYLLKGKNIPFLEEYLQHEIDIRSRNIADDKNWHSLFAQGRKLPFVIPISHFFIFKIECYKYSNDGFLNIIFEDIDEQWYGVVIYCKRDEIDAIISHSRFNTNSSLIRANLAENVLSLDLKKNFSMRHLEIINFEAELIMIMDSDTGLGNPGFYTLSLPGKIPSFYRDNQPNSELPF